MANWIYKGSTSGNSGATTTDTGFDFHAPSGGALGDLLVVWLATDRVGALDLSGIGGLGSGTPQKTGWNALYSDFVPVLGTQHLQGLLAGKLFYPDTDILDKLYHVGLGGAASWAWVTQLWSGTAQLTRLSPPLPLPVVSKAIQGPGGIDRGKGALLGVDNIRYGEVGPANGGIGHDRGPLSRVIIPFGGGYAFPPAIGDYVVVAVNLHDPDGDLVVTVPPEWTVIKEVRNGGSLLGVWGKFFTSDDLVLQDVPEMFWGTQAGTQMPAAFFALSFATDWVGNWYNWSGVNPTTPIADSTSGTVTANTITLSALTSTAPNSTVIAITNTGSDLVMTGTNITGVIANFVQDTVAKEAGAVVSPGSTGPIVLSWPGVGSQCAVALILNAASPITTIPYPGVDDSAATPPETDGMVLVAAGMGAGGYLDAVPGPSLYAERIRSNGANISVSMGDIPMDSDVSSPGTFPIHSADVSPWITVARMLRSFEYNNDQAGAGAPALTGVATPSNTVDLSWTEAANTFGAITEYGILRDDGFGTMVALATVKGTVLTYHDTTAAFNTSYDYQVYGRSGGVSGALSNTVTVTTPSDPAPATLVPPSIPTGLRYSLNNGLEVDLVWNPSVPGGSAITGYTIYQDSVPIGTSVTPSYHDLSVVGSTTYTYTVDCFDANGNQSGESLPLSVTTPTTGPDVTSPSVPTALVATAVSGTEIDLTWGASSDSDSPALGYTIYRDTNPIGAVTGAFFADHGLTPSTEYTYNVDAYDPAGNHSAQSPNATATTLADTAPSAPTGLTGFVNGPYGACLAWIAAVAGSHAVNVYKVLRDAVVIGTTSALKFTDVNCDPARTYVYSVQAYDLIGLASTVSATLSLTTQSTLWTPPKRWELSDPATSLELDTYGRDNLLCLKGTGWTSFTYLNSFAGYHGEAQYRRLGPWIYLQGAVTNPNNNTLDEICTRLPPGFCPLREAPFMVWGKIGASTLPLVVSILPTGDVIIGGRTGSGNIGIVTYCSLNQICFSQDGR